ncbi:hypothetical protein [Halobacillus litoralis]|uniref:hypothetical protein n=1 Tax=Halobacillus litoralis TaxID=45668 RepID=UPI001CFED4B9|nr:hypothetical protein [Halobacillus litoralis]
MINFYIFTALSLLIVVILSPLLTGRFQTNLHHSQRMAISMVSGTSSGLVAGLLLGSIFQGDLFFSTILGISSGAFIGGICNWKLGIVSFIEGLSAGLMGGMMGAMLGEMISIPESIILIKIFITIAVCSLILYPMFAATSCTEQSIQSKKWLLRPFLVFLLVVGFLLGGSWIVDKPIYDQGPHNHHSS